MPSTAPPVSPPPASAAAASSRWPYPAAADGALGFHAILLARAGSAIRSLADAKGARLALAGEDSVAGRLVPMKAFEREGIVPAEFFSSVVRAADPKAAIAMLLSGEADLAVGWSSLSGDSPAATISAC